MNVKYEIIFLEKKKYLKLIQNYYNWINIPFSQLNGSSNLLGFKKKRETR